MRVWLIDELSVTLRWDRKVLAYTMRWESIVFDSIKIKNKIVVKGYSFFLDKWLWRFLDFCCWEGFWVVVVRDVWGLL